MRIVYNVNVPIFGDINDESGEIIFKNNRISVCRY